MSIRISLLIALLAAIACLIIPNSIFAAWSEDPENPMLVSEGGSNTNLHSIADGSGGTYLVWISDVSGTCKAYFQHVRENGIFSFFGGPQHLCTYSASNQTHLSVIADGNGGAYAVWTDNVNGSLNIYCQRFDNTGLLWNSDGMLVCSAPETQTIPKIALNELSGFYVSWRDYRDDSLDIYAQSVNEFGGVNWAPNGIPIAVDSILGSNHKMASDGDGGFFIAWEQEHSSYGTNFVAGQHFNSSGTELWASGGINLPNTVSPSYDFSLKDLIEDESGGILFSFANNNKVYLGQRTFDGDRNFGSVQPINTPGNAYSISIAADGEGGAYVAVEKNTDDGGSSFQHVNSDGYAVFGDEGIALSPVTNRTAYPTVATLLNGNPVVSWVDFSTDILKTRAQSFNQNGDYMWLESGSIIATDNYIFNKPSINPDGSMVFPLWFEAFSIQRLDPHGYLSDPRPLITEITDVPNDQGGNVAVAWSGSYLDSPEHYKITEYSVWMREPAAKNCQMSNSDCAELAKSKGYSSDLIAELTLAGWGYVNTVPAIQEESYFAFGPTFGDSTSTGIPEIEYRIVAHTDDHWVHWESIEATGYSVDNLAPGAPLALAGELLEGGELNLTWQASGSHDEDLDQYLVYRGDAAGFPLDEAHRIGSTASLEYTDHPEFGTWYYRITARDHHENEGTGSNEIDIDSVSAVAFVPMSYNLHGNYPNPFNPQTVIVFDLPQEGAVDLTIYSLDGRVVRNLVSQQRKAGRHELVWNGMDSRGRSMPTGVYLYHLRAGEYEQTRRMSLVR